MSIIEEIHQKHKAFHANIAAKAFRPVVNKVVQPVTKPPVKKDDGDEVAWHMAIEEEVPFLPREPSFSMPHLYVIRKRVCDYFKVSLSDFLSPKRKSDIVTARHVAFYLATKLTRQSLPEIGRRFGGKDHTTVLHGARRIERLIDTDAELAGAIDTLKDILHGRDVSAERKKRKKLTPTIVREIRASEARSTYIAEKYGVSEFTVRQVRARKVWRSVA